MKSAILSNFSLASTESFATNIAASEPFDLMNEMFVLLHRMSAMVFRLIKCCSPVHTLINLAISPPFYLE